MVKVRVPTVFITVVLDVCLQVLLVVEADTLRLFFLNSLCSFLESLVCIQGFVIGIASDNIVVTHKTLFHYLAFHKAPFNSDLVHGFVGDLFS